MRVRLEVLLTIIAKFGATGLSALAAIVTAWSLGSAGVGVFGLIRAIPAVLQLFTEAGVSAASSYLVNRRKHAAQAVLSNALAWGLCVAVVDFAVWAVAADFLNDRFLGGLSAGALFWAGAIAPLSVLQEQVDELLRANQRYRFANLTRLVAELGTLVALLFLYLTNDLTLAGLVVCVLFGRLAALAVGTARIMTLGLRLRPKFDAAILRESLRFGVRAQIGDAINILNYRLDHLILAALTNTNVVGVYVVGSKCAEIFRFLPGAVRFVLEPKIAQISREDAIAAVWRTFWPVLTMNAAIMAVAFLTGPLLIPVFFDEWSTEAVRPFQILLAGLCAMGGTGVIAGYNLGHGQPLLNAYSVAGGLVVTVALDVALIPSYGAVGAAIASSIAYSVSAAVLLMIFVRESRVAERAS